MRRNIISHSIVFVFSLLFMSTSTMAQATSTTTVETIPLSGTLYACNGEPVNFDGTGKTVLHLSRNNIGQVNLSGSGTTIIRAVGEITGANYIARETYSFGGRYDASEPFPIYTTITDSYILIGQGRVPNLKLHVLIHNTINANGELTSSKFIFDVDCNP